MLKEIALFTGFGMGVYPEDIREEIEGKSFIEIRTEVLPNYIRSLEKVSEESIREGLDNMEDGDVIRYEDSMYVAKKYITMLKSKCEIVKVDTSRKWTVSEYDGAEGIKYLEYELVNKELNYWEKE